MGCLKLTYILEIAWIDELRILHVMMHGSGLGHIWSLEACTAIMKMVSDISEASSK